MRNLLNLMEFSQDEVLELISLARAMKKNPADYGSWLKGKSVVTLFEKPSLRTRVTFDIGITRLGGHCIYMDQQNGAIGKRETVRDYAKNLSRWCDGIVARVFDHGTLQGLAKYATVPVINALCNLYHPCQTLADYVTIQEHLGDVSKVKLAYFGDGNNMTNSLFVIGAILGGTVMSVCPKGWGPDAQIFSEAQEIAKKTGAKLTVTDRVEDAAGYDVAYTDTWVSMGDNTPLDTVRSRYMPYQINRDLLKKTGIPYVLHCQPAHRGYEITDDVMDDEKVSLIYPEAENRLHAQMAVLGTLISDKNK